MDRRHWERTTRIHLRNVRIAAFSLSRTEVTFAQWDACVAAGGCNGYRPDDQGWGRGSRPVINVSWNDIRAYLQWLGQGYRLPTEAEWEYAARAGTETAYSTGASISTSQARFNSSSTAPVGSFPANRFGLHDMHGNVWEWVQECYVDSYANAPLDGAAVTAGSCSSRVRRGGAWVNVPLLLRSANRGWSTLSDRGNDLGFRVARTL